MLDGLTGLPLGEQCFMGTVPWHVLKQLAAVQSKIVRDGRVSTRTGQASGAPGAAHVRLGTMEMSALQQFGLDQALAHDVEEMCGGKTAQAVRCVECGTRNDGHLTGKQSCERCSRITRHESVSVSWTLDYLCKRFRACMIDMDVVQPASLA